MGTKPAGMVADGVHEARLASDGAVSSAEQAQQGLLPHPPEGPNAFSHDGAAVPAGLQVLDATMELLRQIDLDTADTGASPPQLPALPQSGCTRQQPSAREDGLDKDVSAPHQRAPFQSGFAEQHPIAVGHFTTGMTSENGSKAADQVQFASELQHTRTEHGQVAAKQLPQADRSQQSDDGGQQAISNAHAAEAAKETDDAQPDGAHTKQDDNTHPAQMHHEVQLAAPGGASLEQGGEPRLLGEQESYDLPSESSAGQSCCCTVHCNVCRQLCCLACTAMFPQC